MLYNLMGPECSPEGEKMGYIKKLDNYRVAKGWSVNKLVSKCDLSESCVKKILSGKTVDPRVSTVNKICKAIGISMAELFQGEGQIVSAASAEIAALIKIFELMPVKSQVYLLSFFESLR